jgi:CRISPR-associated protein Cas5t
MQVLRVEVEIPVCSFRYPHFLVGRQLTFDMPPPSTIFGHVASALGYWPDPTTVRFAYRFTAQGKGDDLEHQHIVTPASGRGMVGGHPVALDATVQPTRRQFLLGARLLLYLDQPRYRDRFEVPQFPVVLGRSQDVACYVRVEEVTLVPADRAYFEHTILPFEFRRRTGRGTTVLMPRYVSPPPARDAHFDPFIVLQERVFYDPQGGGEADGSLMLAVDRQPLDLLVDPESQEHRGMRRAVWLEKFVQ